MKVYTTHRVAITTRYMGPTNYRGARIKAKAPDGQSVTIDYDHSECGQCLHARAALKLVEKMEWGREELHLLGGATGDGYVWLLAGMETEMEVES